VAKTIETPITNCFPMYFDSVNGIFTMPLFYIYVSSYILLTSLSVSTTENY
jgi:hypothetical protein